MRLLRKSGRPFLLLPTSGNLASQCLELYPAQTAKAKAVRSLLRVAFKTGLDFATQPVTIEVSEKNELFRYFRHAGGADAIIPQFGILAGNPAADSQRFIFILFSPSREPAAVVKLGLTAKAKKLVMTEGEFLSSAGLTVPGLPRIREKTEASGFAAITLPYIDGGTPKTDCAAPLHRLLGSWISEDQRLPLNSIENWRTLQSACPPDEFRRLGPRMKNLEVAKTLSHGDFAPWNVKEGRDGNWMAIDWERGQLAGIPGWDWFHFLLQHAILVRGKDVPDLVGIAEELLISAEFREYAVRTGIAGVERQILAAYLAHVVHVLRPAERFEVNSALYQAWVAKLPVD
jgi:hypothetical protein